VVQSFLESELFFTLDHNLMLFLYGMFMVLMKVLEKPFVNESERFLNYPKTPKSNIKSIMEWIHRYIEELLHRNMGRNHNQSMAPYTELSKDKTWEKVGKLMQINESLVTKCKHSSH